MTDSGLSDGWLAGLVRSSFPDPVVVVDETASLVWANETAERRFGWRWRELAGESLAHLVHPDDLGTAVFSLASVRDKVAGTVVELRLRDHTGSYSWFEIRGAPERNGSGPAVVVLALRDSTDRRRWEIGSGDTEMLRGVLDATDALTILLSRDGLIRGANRSLTRLLRRPLETTIGAPLVDIVMPADRPVVISEIELAATASGRRSLEARLWRPDGSSVPFALTIVNLLDDRAVAGLVVSGADISDLVSARERLRHLATHDDLTGLPNRAVLRETLQQLLATGGRPGFTLVFADVDDLKAINDAFGHRAGDLVLTRVAGRLRRVLRPHDVVARISGDEFAIVAETSDPGLLADLQRRIEGAMREPIALPDGSTVVTSITLGGAPLDEHHNVDDALAAADAAMYLNKRARRQQPSG